VIEEREFEGVASSVSRARSFAVAASGADARTADVLRLVVSELATNAVLHAGSAFTVRVIRARDLLRVEIADHCVELPTPRQHSPRAVTGRGLSIVEQMVARWGVIPEVWGKRVWFELRPPA